MTNRFFRTLSILVLVWLLSACGGSDGRRFDGLVSFGDSLSDTGSYDVGTIAALDASTGGAGRFTINRPGGSPLWLDHLARTFDLPAPCPAETGLQPNLPGLVGAPVTAHPGCFDYAQGGARVTSPLAPNSVALQALGQQTLGVLAKPIANQMAAHLVASGGRYTGRELVTVFAGANDVLMELLTTAATDPVQAVANVAADGATLATLIRTEVVGKGARQVLVLTLPDIAQTPYIRSLEPLQPGVGALTDAMVLAFNAQLVAGLKNVPGIRLGDAYSVNKDQILHPQRYGLSNVTTPACGPNALGTTSLACNASNTIAADVSRYEFADDFHPTPYGHSLLADLALATLAVPLP